MIVELCLLRAARNLESDPRLGSVLDLELRPTAFCLVLVDVGHAGDPEFATEDGEAGAGGRVPEEGGVGHVVIDEGLDLGLALDLQAVGTVVAELFRVQEIVEVAFEIGGDVDWLPMRSNGMSLVIRDVTLSGA